jgi:hypothetical protein
MTSLPEYLTEFKSKVERRLGTVIDFVEDRETQFPAKIEYARNYAREHHVVRYNPNKCKNAYPLEAIKSLALEIAMLGTRGISPTSKYTLKGLPNRGEILGSEVLAYYYVTWAKVFPDKLDLIGLPYKQAYASAVAMLERMGGDNSTKTPRGVIRRIIFPMAV